MLKYPTSFPMQIDMNEGLLCFYVFWRPEPGAANPYMPGQKHQSFNFVPLRRVDPCRCGSDRPFGDCCRLKPYLQSICPNPGCSGFSPIQQFSATFDGVDATAIRKVLGDKSRWKLVQDSPGQTAWIYWGEPICESKEGIYCFGDLALRSPRTLVATTLSETRSIALNDALHRDLTKFGLPEPTIFSKPALVYDKVTKELVTPGGESRGVNAWTGWASRAGNAWARKPRRRRR